MEIISLHLLLKENCYFISIFCNRLVAKHVQYQSDVYGYSFTLINSISEEHRKNLYVHRLSAKIFRLSTKRK